jgi:hypothetical protein
LVWSNIASSLLMSEGSNGKLHLGRAHVAQGKQESGRANSARDARARRRCGPR